VTLPLLATKLCLPPARPNLVPRPRLIRKLGEGLALGHRLALVSAPAGFGKTTLVTEWVHSGTRPVAWLSVDEGDNDPVRFLAYLIAALQQIHAPIGQTVQRALRSPQAPALPALMSALINDVTTVALPLSLVLDDYHQIGSTPVHQLLQFLLEHQPPSLQLVISTREDPPLPLARLRARNQVTEVRERDLRFTAAEVAAFLNQTMGLDLSSEAVSMLEARTEGWIAGLQMAALALQEERSDAEAFIAAFAGDDRFVVDYLVAEVLQRQPASLREFLRQTSILDRLTASLCDALMGQNDSQAILEQLEGTNVFLTPLDNRREWYRYHQLFAEFLRTELSEEELQPLHCRAARWYEEHGLTSQAIRHALAYGALSGDTSDAERLILCSADDTLHGGGLLTLRGWLDALPEERLHAEPRLATYKGWVLALLGDMSLAGEYARVAEPPSGPAEAVAPPDKLLLLRSWIALLAEQDYERASELARGALQQLGEDRLHWQVIAHWVMAESLERTRHITEAIEAFEKARRVGLALGNHIFVATVEMSLALSLNNHGKRREAVAMCEETIARYTDASGHPTPLAGLIYSRLGMLYYESNELDKARACHERSQALIDQINVGGELNFAYGFSVPTLYAQGETEAALQILQRARRVAGTTGYADASWFMAMEANLRLREGDVSFALRWADEAGLSPQSRPEYLRIEEHLIYARLLLVQHRTSDARRWLDRLAHFTEQRGLRRWSITVHILHALLANRMGDAATARGDLAAAVSTAAPQEYLRAFLDEDTEVLALLPQVRSLAPAFVDRILGAARGGELPPRVADQPLVEPLTERELEVLHLIAAGLKNREIADRLFIALGTVKRHINNIYGKLDVHSRTQAIARARELDLLR